MQPVPNLADFFDLEDDLTPPIAAKEVSLERAYGVRPYQSEAIRKVELNWNPDVGIKKQLVVAATGTGKTPLMAILAKREVERGGRVLALAHTDELIDQLRDKIQAFAKIGAAKEKAECYASRREMIVVGSVQTMSGDMRLSSWKPNHFTLVMVDEAHRTLAASYLKVLDKFCSGGARVVGVTATADRGDKRELGDFYEKIAFEYNLRHAVRDGWLIRPIVETMPLEIDLNGVHTKGRDLDQTEVGARLTPFLGRIAAQVKAKAPTGTFMFFLPSVDTSRLMAEALNAVGIAADWVSGDRPERRDIVKAFKAGRTRALCNMAVLCLDSKTEILTRRGFLGVDAITSNDLVANWEPDGSVFFAKPEEIVRRPTAPGERMVSIDSKTINLRVTETHRMIRSAGAERGAAWTKIPARDLSNGHMLPAFGLAEPDGITIPQPEPKTDWRRIAANSYHLRKNGMSYDEARAEATRRAESRDSLRYTQPSELSLDDCRFIGFWVADGGRNKLQSGGVEYTLCQSTTYPRIIEWVDRVIAGCCFDSIKRLKPAGEKGCDFFVWSLPRGTGFGSQAKNGVFRIEPYLEKNGVDYLWGLNEQQFDALCEGYWMGDGNHRKAEHGTPSTLKYSDTKRPWIDLLCAIGSVRNWRCAISHVPRRAEHHKDQWQLTMVKRRNLHVSFKTPVVIEELKQEEVWCVKTTSKNIITRRDGHVTIMGNTEGFDHDAIDTMVILRPTKIRSLFVQMAGRAARPLNTIVGALNSAPNALERLKIIKSSAKPYYRIFDFLWLYEKHDLVQPASLVTSQPTVQKEMQGVDGDLMDLGERAERDVLAKLEEEVKKNARKAAYKVDPLAIAAETHDLELVDYEPETKNDAMEPTEKQLKILTANGVDVSKLKYRGHASQLICRVIDRHQKGLATFRQLHFLAQLGVDGANMTREEATAAIEAKKSAKA